METLLSQIAAQAEMQKQQAISRAQKVQDMNKLESQFDVNKMQQTAAQLDQQILTMKSQFSFDMQLKQMDMLDTQKAKEKEIEDRKDNSIQNFKRTQQSEMISQRKNDLLPIDFESPQSRSS